MLTFEQAVSFKEFELNDTDDTIIEYLRSNRADILKVSVQKVASDLFISPNAVIRLSKKLGYSGFSELKYTIQNEDKPDLKTLSSKLMDKLPSNIVKTIDTIDNTILESVAELIKKARCCIFAGVGDSTYFCEMLGKNLRCLDFNVQYYTQIHDMFFAVEHANNKDILIVISARGENKRLLELVKKAKQNKMIVVSITHFYNNTLAKESDQNLYFWGEERTVKGYNVTDRSGLMVLVRLLSECIWKDYGK